MNTNKKRLIIFSVLFILVGVIFLTSLNVFAETTTTQAVREYVGESFCSEPSVKKILRLAGYLLIVAKIMIPLIIISLGTSSLYKSLTSTDASKELGTQIKNLAIRVVLGVFIFFIPDLVDWTIGLIADEANSNTKCIDCVLTPKECDIESNS